MRLDLTLPGAALCLALAPACNGTSNNINALQPDIIIAGDATDTVDFGEVIVQEQAEKSFQILNAGRADLRVTDIRVEGDDASAYTVGATELEVEPDGAATVSVSFAPGDLRAYDTVLVIDSNDPDAPSYEVDLLALGVDGPIPDIELSASSLDFGTVAAGTSATEFVQIRNVGDGPLLIDRIDQVGSGNFTIEAGPRTGGEIAGPGETSLIIGYAPGTDDGDAASFTIYSDDPDEPSVTLDVLGNGGSELEYPEAVIDCPDSAAPPTTLTLDGSASTDPGGLEPLNYEWTVVRQPTGSLTVPTTPYSATTDLFVDLAGAWVVELRVTNTDGLTSAPATCSFRAQPEDNLHVELVWNIDNADLDLHLIEDGSEFFDGEGDCCWCNPNPSWGGAGSTDDPLLALDNEDGFGPENIKVGEPDDGQYRVKVHYFSDLGGGPATATVRVWFLGDTTPFYEGSAVMTNKQAWDVGTVRWGDAPTFAEDNADPYYTSQSSCQLP